VWSMAIPAAVADRRGEIHGIRLRPGFTKDDLSAASWRLCRRSGRHACPASALRRDHPHALELSVGAAHRPGSNVPAIRELPHRRQALAGEQGSAPTGDPFGHCDGMHGMAYLLDGV
jgi:hypothetical protein